MTRLSAEKLVLALAFRDVQLGTQMAAAYVDTDGTATIQLLERTPITWRNLTTHEDTTPDAIAAKYDDVVVTRLPEQANGDGDA